ncbi:MAG: response regulator [Campylobacteraceae bacterium]|nr:response regulator [Campylobacteraceae bacterium]
MSINKFRILIIEDESEISDTLIEELYKYGNSIDITLAENVKEALTIIKDTPFFDLITLDLQIPSDKGKLDQKPEHGLSILAECQEYAKGTPVIILTGTGTEDMIDEFLGYSNRHKIWFDNNKYSTISYVSKVNTDKFFKKIEDIYNSVKKLFEIELQTSESLPIEHDRLIRMFTKSQSAVFTKVKTIGGGLSGVKVYALEVFNEQGHVIIKTIAKCGKMDEVNEDANNYEKYINRLDQSVTPRKIIKINYGAKSNSGVFYGLVTNYDFSYFGATKENKNNSSIRESIKEILKPWHSAKTQHRTKIIEIRRSLVSDKIAQKLVEKYDLSWVTEIEEILFQSTKSCYHGDLHGENILIDTSGNTSTLIDYGDVNEGASTIDPITLECSFLFHPDGLDNKGWPTIENLNNWEDLEKYIEGCPIPDEISFCRKWTEELSVGKRDIGACLYAYALRQLKYPDTDKSLALALLNTSRRIILEQT